MCAHVNEIDFYNGPASPSILLTSLFVETTGTNFNTILRMKAKTANTLQGLQNTVQLTSRPLNTFIRANEHDQLLLELAHRGVVIMKPDELHANDNWKPFGILTKRICSSVLHGAMVAAGIEQVRLLQVGDKMPVEQFVDKIGPHLLDTKHSSVLDLTSNCATEDVNCIPLAFVDKNDRNYGRTETLNSFGVLGCEHVGPSGSVRITCPPNTPMIPWDPLRGRSNAHGHHRHRPFNTSWSTRPTRTSSKRSTCNPPCRNSPLKDRYAAFANFSWPSSRASCARFASADR